MTDPERKRKIIGEEFIRVFEAEAKKLGRVDYLAQGTIYPDVIESGTGDAATIKSHQMCIRDSLWRARERPRKFLEQAKTPSFHAGSAKPRLPFLNHTQYITRPARCN